MQASHLRREAQVPRPGPAGCRSGSAEGSSAPVVPRTLLVAAASLALLLAPTAERSAGRPALAALLDLFGRAQAQAASAPVAVDDLV
ncbi:MAG: hypothetical protein ACKOCT_04725, partial [Alphaproteobacteria bacterium]